MAIFKKKQRTIGGKVSYILDGKQHTGSLHGKRTYENSSGVVERTTYIIDTGDKNPIDPEQPELIELDADLVQAK